MSAAVETVSAPDAAGLPAAPVRDGAAGAALGKYADLTSAHTGSTTYDIHAVLPPPATVKAWYLRSYGRDLVRKAVRSQRGEGEGSPALFRKVPRVAFCGSRIAPRCEGVGLYSRPDRAYGRVSGVCVCGQSLACPVCAPRIAAFRATEVAECFKRAAAAGYEARLVTFTIPHAAGSRLGEEMDCFRAAWDRFQSGRRAVAREEKSLGNHVGRECTWSRRAGWHYHHHVCRYDEPGTFIEEAAQADWLAALDAVGRKWRGADEHAFDAGIVGTDAGARYVAKLSTSVEAQSRAIGLEVSASSLKGRNLSTLLQAASQGDDEAGKVWVAGVADIVSRKVSSVRWSRGLRAAVSMSGEKTDAQVAVDEVLDTDVFLGALNPMQWQGVLKWRAEFALCVAANRGLDAVNAFLDGLGLGKLNDDDPRKRWRLEREGKEVA